MRICQNEKADLPACCYAPVLFDLGGFRIELNIPAVAKKKAVTTKAVK
jgi:hypothetical protein|tara:strand:+ start:48 stop:191 length:144 start_codon:yes stop_codon:yes gene_type:complete